MTIEDEYSEFEAWQAFRRAKRQLEADGMIRADGDGARFTPLPIETMRGHLPAPCHHGVLIRVHIPSTHRGTNHLHVLRQHVDVALAPTHHCVEHHTSHNVNTLPVNNAHKANTSFSNSHHETSTALSNRHHEYNTLPKRKPKRKV